MYKTEEIIEAFQNLSSPDLKAVDNANKIIMEWQSSYLSILQAIEIVMGNNDVNVIFPVLQVAKNNILKNWTKYPIPDRAVIRDNLCNKSLEFKGDQLVLNELIYLVAILVTKDWPHEWPDAIQIFLDAADTSEEVCSISLKIIAIVIELSFDSEQITIFRKKQIQEELNPYVVKLIEKMEEFIKEFKFEKISDAMAQITAALCRYLDEESLTTGEWLATVIELCCSQYAGDNFTSQIFENLLLKRTDSTQFFIQTADTFLPIFKQLIERSSDECYKTILRILDRYGPDIENSCSDGQDDTITEPFSTMISSILTRIVSDSYIEEYWVFWHNVLHRMLLTVKSNNKFDSLSNVAELYDPLLPDIRESLFNNLPSAIIDGKLKSNHVYFSWALMTEYDVDGTVEFLQAQHPTITVCYALGISDANFNSKLQNDFLLEALPVIFQANQEQNTVDFGIAILYLLSHSTRFIFRNDIFRQAFAQILPGFLLHKEPKVQTNAARALKYMAKEAWLLCVRQPMPIFNLILDKFGSICADIDLKAAKKVVFALYTCGTQMDDPEILDILSRPILDMLIVNDSIAVDRSLHIIKSLTKLPKEHLQRVLHIFVEEIAKAISFTRDQSEALYSMNLDCLCTVYSYFPYDDLLQNIDEAVALIFELDHWFDTSLLYISTLRRIFDGVEIYFDKVHQILVTPLLSTMRDTRSEILSVVDFYRSFRIREGDVEWLVLQAIDFINDQEIGISERSVGLLQTILTQLMKDGQYQLIVNLHEPILRTILGSLTDTFHNSIFIPLCELFQTFYKAMTSSTFNNATLDKEVAEEFERVCEDSSTAKQVAKLLRTSVSNPDEFIRILREFVVSMRFASETDKGLFKKTLKTDALKKELELLSAAKQVDPTDEAEAAFLQAFKRFTGKKTS